MNNSEMKAGRILKIQTGKRKLAFILGNLEAGRNVYISTATRATKLSKKHAGMIRMGKSGSLYLQKDCIDFCGLSAS